MEAFEKYLSIVNSELKKLSFPEEPNGLYTSIDYFLTIGGKRIRPILTLITAEMFSGKIEQEAIDAALGIELFHNFTLLHDDIMDNAPLRRNAVTVHEKWNTNTAILSGDVLYTLALEKIIESNHKAVNQVFLKTAREVCEGQQSDMLFESQKTVTVEQYIEMIRLKTSVLIGCALEVGAILGGANQEDQALCYELGINIGLAFQLQDDYLDTFGTHAKVGKRIGGDILENKKTFIYLKARELASEEQHQQMEELSREKEDETKIKGFQEIYQILDIPNLSKERISFYFDKGLANLNALTISDEKKEKLSQFIHYLYNRNY